MPPFSFSSPSVVAFVVLPIVLIGVFAWGVDAAWQRDPSARPQARRAGLIAFASGLVWMALTGLVANSGVLREWSAMPPPFFLFMLSIFVVAFGISSSSVGKRIASLPLWVLVAVQSFRLPLELAMHRLSEHGIMPEQMSYSGRNWDIVTGVTAILVAALLKTNRIGRAGAFVWNIAGLALLANILIVAVRSTPRFAAFGPDRLNVFVTYVPFVWLPAIMVLAALAGHLIIFRALRRA